MSKNPGLKIKIAAVAAYTAALGVTFYVLSLNRASYDHYESLTIFYAVLTLSTWFGLTAGLVFAFVGVFIYGAHYYFRALLQNLPADIGMEEAVWLTLIPVASIVGGFLGDSAIYVQKFFRRYHHQVEALLLTGQLSMMGNAVTFAEALREECARARRALSQFTLIFLDIGNVGEVQKLLGMDGPEEAAKHISKAICSNTRDIDSKAKLGTTLFGVILPECKKAQSPVVIDRIQKGLQEVELEYRNRVFKLPLKMITGIASYPEDGDVPEKLNQHASKDLVENQRVYKDLKKVYRDTDPGSKGAFDSEKARLPNPYA